MDTKNRSRRKKFFANFWYALKSKRTRQILIKILILVLGAIFSTWLLEYRHYLNDAGAANLFIVEKPRVFFYTALIMFFIVLGFYGLYRKPFITIATVASIVVAVGYIHISKFNFRGTPLLPEDFQLGTQAGAMMKFVDPWSIVRLIIAIVLIVFLGKIFDRLTAKWLFNDKPAKSNVWWRRYRVVSRVAILAVATTGFLLTTNFATHHENAREIKIDFLGSKFTDWNQTQNYDENGFLIGFLYNAGELESMPPDGYTESKIAEIKTDLEKIADAEKKTRVALSKFADDDVNIIIVLNESFFDPENVREYYNYTGGDVTPNLHELQKKTWHGEMFSVDYGGGTANIEYEVMTGLTNYFLKTVPYTNYLPKQKTIPSIASFAKENGYATTAIHPFNGGVYKRDNVLPKMGFEEFITENEFKFDEKDGVSEYRNDRSSYAQVLDVLENSDKPQLISLITMQNHAPYNPNMYGESKFKIESGASSDTEKNAAETYLMTLNLADKYLGEFYEKLQNFNEKTIVLFYGDHSGGVFSNVIESSDKNVSQSARKTPYLIFANFDLENSSTKNTNSASSANSISSNARNTGDAATQNLTLPTTTPNCLTNTLLNLMNSEKPLVNYLLDNICKTTPILTDAYFDSETPFMSTELSSYELLTYDIVAGKQYFLAK